MIRLRCLLCARRFVVGCTEFDRVVGSKFSLCDGSGWVEETGPTRTTLCGHVFIFVSASVKAKFHYTDPTGPARTQRSFAAKKVRAGPCGSGRVRVGSA